MNYTRYVVTSQTSGVLKLYYSPKEPRWDDGLLTSVNGNKEMNSTNSEHSSLAERKDEE